LKANKIKQINNNFNKNKTKNKKKNKTRNKKQLSNTLAHPRSRCSTPQGRQTLEPPRIRMQVPALTPKRQLAHPALMPREADAQLRKEGRRSRHQGFGSARAMRQE
jgi:hypothetical protein